MIAEVFISNSPKSSLLNLYPGQKQKNNVSML